MKMVVGLTYDLRKDYLAEGFTEEQAGEFDSEETINHLQQTIEKLGYKAERIGNAKALCRQLAAGQRWDLVFNIAEGIGGRNRESQVPCMLEAYDIPYTFSDGLSCAITLDKALAKKIIQSAGIPTSSFCVVENLQDIKKINLKFPVFVKPIAEGTGKGIDANSLVEKPQKLKEVCKYLLEKFEQPLLIEEFLPGREFTVGVLGNGDKAKTLGIMEIEIPGDPNGIYSFTAKEECEQLVNYKPYRDKALYGIMSKLAVQSHNALQCRDASRVDFRCDAEGKPNFLEINPLPGLHPSHSDLPMIATQEKMSYSDLIKMIIENAIERCKIPVNK